MGLLSPGFGIARNDPRVKPCAYVHDGKHLFEVVRVLETAATLENCCTGARFSVTVGQLLTGFKLAKRAPEVPDAPAA